MRTAAYPAIRTYGFFAVIGCCLPCLVACSGDGQERNSVGPDAADVVDGASTTTNNGMTQVVDAGIADAAATDTSLLDADAAAADTSLLDVVDASTADSIAADVTLTDVVDGAAADVARADGNLADVVDDSPPDVVVSNGDAGTVTVVRPDGGLCSPIASSVPPACGASLCGNGVVDTCTIPSACNPGPIFDSGICTRSVTESCDGTNLGGASCASLGFAGGTLACATTCNYDARGCVTCANGSRILQCKELVDCAPVQSFALAALGQTLAAAWVTGNPAPGTVRFGLFAPDLSPVSLENITGITDGVRVALAATPSGWILAVERSTVGLEVIALQASGAVSGPAKIVAGGTVPVMAPRGDSASVSGGPLLVWSEPAGSRVAVLVASDASFQTSPVRVSSGDVVEPQFSGGTFTGDAFLYGERTNGVTITRLALDGTIAAVHQPANSSTEYPQLAWLGDHAALTYADFSSTGALTFQQLTANGAALGSPVVLGTTVTKEYNRSPMVALSGGDVAVLLGGYTGGTDHTDRLDVTALSGSGSVVVTAFPLMRDPMAATAWRAIRLGTNVIAGWIGETNADTYLDSGSFHLARIAQLP